MRLKYDVKNETLAMVVYLMQETIETRRDLRFTYSLVYNIQYPPD